MTDNWQKRMQSFGRSDANVDWKTTNIDTFRDIENEIEKCLINVRQSTLTMCLTIEHCDRFHRDRISAFDWSRSDY
jgi:hypothetical protein